MRSPLSSTFYADFDVRPFQVAAEFELDQIRFFQEQIEQWDHVNDVVDIQQYALRLHRCVQQKLAMIDERLGKLSSLDQSKAMLILSQELDAFLRRFGAALDNKIAGREELRE